jgi:selenocysteine lyase/cysteine desulfurase
MKMKSFEILPETRQAIGAFFGCKPEQVALTPNFSIGLNFLLEGLDLKNRVLLLKNDYPSLNWPFESRGFKLHYVECDAQLETRILEKVARQHIDILALSLVQWINGIMISDGFLKELKRLHPHLLILADGTQYCGAYAFDFGKSSIDVLGASGYKWLLGGYGNAFFMFKPGAMKRFHPKATGFNASGGDLNGQHNIPFPRQLEPGHLDSLNFGSLKFSLEQLSSIGMHSIENHNRTLARHFRQGLKGTAFLGPEVWDRREHSSIFNILGDQALFGYLRKQKIICSQRGSGIRIGFHLYNTLEEVDRVLTLLLKAKV